MSSGDEKPIWLELIQGQPGAQRRFGNHPLRLHYGTNDLGQPILLLRLDKQPEAPELGNAVTVEVGERAGYGEWTMVLTLHEQALTGTFIDLCVDLASRSALAEDEAGSLRLFHSALQDFKDLLLGSGGQPSLERIRGLVGELWFALRIVAPKLGPEGAVMAWTGPLGAAHDFRDPSNALFEIKAIHAEARSIKISSVEQLDPAEPSPLTMVTVALEERQPEARDALSLTSLVAEFRDALVVHPGKVTELDRRLEALGVGRLDSVDDRHFAVVGFRQYRVEPGFPRLLREHIPAGVAGIGYQIRLSAISSYELVDQPIPGEGQGHGITA